MNLKVRLAVMNFIEFAVWGAYLTCMGNYLGIAGLGDKISWFYAIQGIVSIFMPTLMGIVADKYVQPQRLLGLCHLLAGGFMLGCWWLGTQAGFGNELPDKSLFIAMYTLSVAFFMPTIALANTAAFTILKNNQLDTIKDFPPIRVLGTVGFIATMWFVNCAYVDETGFGFTLAENAHKFQYTYMQFFVSGLLSMGLFAYCYTLPECKLEKKRVRSRWLRAWDSMPSNCSNVARWRCSSFSLPCWVCACRSLTVLQDLSSPVSREHQSSQIRLLLTMRRCLPLSHRLVRHCAS